MMNKIHKHIDAHQMLGAVVAMFFILGVSSFIFNQSASVHKWYERKELEVMDPEEFFVQYSVVPTQETFRVGERPSFFFRSEYFVAGHVEGSNTIKCDFFRSSIFKGEGYISRNQINITNEAPGAFVFGGTLPTMPQQNCFLSSIITLCEPKYNICKTQKINSDPFNYIQ